MKGIQKALAKIPAMLSSNVSIFIYLFLFFYLVIYALVCAIVPALSGLAPSDTLQLILGNYTNVLSALGASIAAGAGVITQKHVRDLHKKHDEMHQMILDLHDKVDQMKGNTEDK